MVAAHVKRIRMHRQLSGWLPEPSIPQGFQWLAWHDDLLDTHAGVLFLSFENTVDARLFPNLACLAGSRMLLRWIRDCSGFCPQATWLLMGLDGAVGTVHGVIDEGIRGSIQNIGVLPSYRRQGLGMLLLAKALHGFLAAGATQAHLEVTAANPNAQRLYRRLGFKPYNSYLRRIERHAVENRLGI